MKKVASDRFAPQVPGERDAMDNPPGTPQHLLSEALMSTQGLLGVVEQVLIRLDQTTTIPSAEGRNQFQFSQLIDQIDAIAAHDSSTHLEDELNTCPPIENYFPIHAEVNGYYQNQQSLKQFTDIKAYGTVVLREIKQCFDETWQDVMRLVNMLGNYSQTLFILIPQLEEFYNCKNDAVEMIKINAQIMLMCEKSIRIGARYQLSELLDKNDYYSRVKEHVAGSILLQVEALLAELYQRKHKLTCLKVVHPPDSSSGISDLHALLYNAGLFHDEFLFHLVAIKECVRGSPNKTNELNKSGFSYACDKVIADYLSAHQQKIDAVDKKVSTVIKQERRRSRSEDFPLKPVPPPLTSQSTSKETWEGRFLGRRNNRVNSMGEVQRVSSPEPPAVPTNPKTGVVSLSRGSSFGKLLSTLPKDKTTSIPSASRQSGDNKRQSGDNSIKTPVIQKPPLEAIPEEMESSDLPCLSSPRASREK